MEMEETVSFFQNPYGWCILLFSLMAAGLTMLSGRKKNVPLSATGLYAILAGVLGLFLGRLVYCAVRFEFMFYDEIGNFAGLSAFFDVQNGSVNVGGILLGFLLAAPITKGITGQRAASLLDAAALPGLFLYSALRFAEPLSGQGYGEWMENEALWFSPLCIQNDWGEWMLSVCFIEGVLTLILLIVLLCLVKKMKAPGTLTLYTLCLFSALQVLPECLRCDDVLFVLIFARVTHIALACTLFFTQFAALLRGKKRGLATKTLALESGLMLIGIVLCIGTIFALDKTNIPDIYVYLVMIVSLCLMVFLTCRRIRKEDQ